MAKLKNKNNVPTITKIRAVLRECPFNPKKPGPMKLISQAGNLGYYKCRAIEALEAGEYIMAIRLIILLVLGSQNEKNETGKAKARGKGK